MEKEKNTPPLLRMDSFYIDLDEGLNDDVQKVIVDLLKEHKDWRATVDIKWRKAEVRNI